MQDQLFKHGYAFLVGVGGDLPETVRDATAIRDTLVDPDIAAYPTGNVTLLTSEEATRANILNSLNDFVEKVNKDSEATVFIYYSGHGGRRKLDGESDHTYFLCPHDYDSFDEESMISGKIFSEKLNSISARRQFVVLDCCHASGIPQKGAGRNSEFIQSNRDLIQMLSGGKGKVVIASCDDNEVSYGGNPFSLFTTCLLDALKGCNSDGEDGYVHVLKVLDYLITAVPGISSRPPYKTQQNPVITDVKDLDSKFFICRYNENTAMLTKLKGDSEVAKLFQKKEEPGLKVHNYGKVETQVNVDVNKGVINISNKSQ